MESSLPKQVPVVTPAKDPGPEGRTRKNLAIQGLRGLAAIAVVLYHLPFMAANIGLSYDIPAGFVQKAYLESGHYCVCLFFCISGFLIVQSLIRQGSVRKFARNRVARIYPLFGLITLLVFAIGPFTNYRWLGDLDHDLPAWGLNLVSNLLFLPGVFDLPIAQHVAWSLSYEACFYLLAVLAFVALRRKTRSPGAIVAGLAAVAGIVAFAVFRPLSLYFAVGTICYLILERLTGERFRLPAPLGMICLVAGLIAFTLDNLYGLPFAFIVFATLVMQQGWLSGLLSTKPLTYLGRISYSLYLVHPLATDAVRMVAARLLPDLGDTTTLMLFSILSVAFSVLLAELSYRLIEVALTNRLFFRKRRLVPA